MARLVRIGNAHGFWGDRIDAAAELLSAEPDLDFVTLDFLAEVSLSILALQRARQPEAGWPRDFLHVIDSLTPYWLGGGRCRLIANAGGLNPHACARACQQRLTDKNCDFLRLAVVEGDNVLEHLRAAPLRNLFRNLDTNEPLSKVADHLMTANAYLGASPLVEALAAGADIVITGRVADPSLTVAACMAHHGWQADDWPRIAQATVAGHLIECGTQVTGGIATDWLETPGLDQIGFPIVEVDASGDFVVTKARSSGGRVSLASVTEQLVYEIGDPDAYLSPDATVSFQRLELQEVGIDRIQVRGATGGPPPPTYKVSATYQDGYRAQGQLTIYGDRAVTKARRAGQVVLNRLKSKGITLRESLIECLGTGACHPGGDDTTPRDELSETVLRIAVADPNPEHVEEFTRALMPLITAGPPGITGYADGRPRVHPIFRYWPCLIERTQAWPHVHVWPEPTRQRPPAAPPVEATVPPDHGRLRGTQTNAKCVAVPKRLGDLARARSGDKGQNANIGVLARNSEDVEWIGRELRPERVAAWLGLSNPECITCYALPTLGAFNLVIRGILSNSLKTDAQGKCLGQVLLQMPLSEGISP